ncbi:hypothetical protein BJ170DRAFT_725427 [Xylariales sp. AK1849]|nr:hypothetical protein BJ170DRAFT_725427 [Xylariales sp. AK1849]
MLSEIVDVNEFESFLTYKSIRFPPADPDDLSDSGGCHREKIQESIEVSAYKGQINEATEDLSLQSELLDNTIDDRQPTHDDEYSCRLLKRSTSNPDKTKTILSPKLHERTVDAVSIDGQGKKNEWLHDHYTLAAGKETHISRQRRPAATSNQQRTDSGKNSHIQNAQERIICPRNHTIRRQQSATAIKHQKHIVSPKNHQLAHNRSQAAAVNDQKRLVHCLAQQKSNVRVPQVKTKQPKCHQSRTGSDDYLKLDGLCYVCQGQAHHRQEIHKLQKDNPSAEQQQEDATTGSRKSSDIRNDCGECAIEDEYSQKAKSAAVDAFGTEDGCDVVFASSNLTVIARSKERSSHSVHRRRQLERITVE